MTIESTTASFGVRAYQIGRGMEATSDAASLTDRKGPSFEDMARAAAQGTVNTVRHADSVSQAAIMGQASTQEVVEATLAMRHAVESTVAIRDQVVRCYQELLRMPV